MNDIKKILANSDSSDISNDKLAALLLAYIKKNKKNAKKYITKGGLNFLLNLELDRYFIGCSDYFFPEIIEFIKKEVETEEDMIRYSAQSVIRLISFMTDEVCPACHQSNLFLYTNEAKNDVYEVCEECLARRLNGEWIQSREELFQADKFQIQEYMRAQQN